MGGLESAACTSESPQVVPETENINESCIPCSSECFVGSTSNSGSIVSSPHPTPCPSETITPFCPLPVTVRHCASHMSRVASRHCRSARRDMSDIAQGRIAAFWRAWPKAWPAGVILQGMDLRSHAQCASPFLSGRPDRSMHGMGRRKTQCRKTIAWYTLGYFL